MNVPRNDRLESMLEEIQEFRRHRFDVAAMGPMVPRGFKRRPRPKTAIITEAVLRAQARRESAELVTAAHQRVARQRPCSRMGMGSDAVVFAPYQKSEGTHEKAS
jgi:hypothetical protein